MQWQPNGDNYPIKITRTAMEQAQAGVPDSLLREQSRTSQGKA